MARLRQAGQGKIGCVLWVLAFTIAAMAAFKMIPVRIKVGELTDYASEQAKWAASQEAEKIRTRLHNKARELELPVAKEQIQVTRTSSKLQVRMNFMVPIEFPGYTYEWNFDIDREWDIFIF